MNAREQTTEEGWRERAQPLALAWQRAVTGGAYTPLAQSEIQARFEELTNEALAVMMAPSHVPATELHARARGVGEQLVTLRLSSPEVLERTLSVLADRLPPVSALEGELLAGRLALFLSGLAGGFAQAARAVVLTEQEAIHQAYALALQGAQSALAAERDRLARANEALNAEVAERIRAEASLGRQAAHLAHLHKISLGVLSAAGLTEIIDTGVSYIQESIGAYHVSVSLYDDARRESKILVSSVNDHFVSGERFPVTMQKELSRVRGGDPIYIPDVQAQEVNSPGYKRVLEMGGRSLLAVPIGRGSNFVGVMSIIEDRLRVFTGEEVAAARELCDLMAVAIQNRRLLEAEQEALRREATLRDLATNLSLSLELDEYLRRVLERLDELVPALSSSVVLLQDGDPILVSKRPPQEIPAHWFRLIMARNSDSMGWVFRNGRARVIPDTTAVPGWVVVPGFETVHSWLGVPLLVKGACIGVLTLDRERVDAFAPQDVEVALAFAAQVAVAIENARLFNEVQTQKSNLEERVRERTRELNALYGITAATVENPDLPSVLRRSLELTVEVFGCRAGAIYLADDAPPGLRLADCLDRSERDWAQALAGPRVAQGLRRQIGYDGAPWIGTEGDVPRYLPLEGLRGVAVAPLRARERRLGLLCLLSDTPDPISEAGLLLATVADQIGAAVENIELRHKTRQAAIIAERERLARDLHDAVTQAVYGIGLFANAAGDAARSGDLAKLERHLQTVQQTAQSALKEMRLLLFELRTEDLARLGLAGALHDRLQKVEERIGMATELRVGHLPPLPVAHEEVFYRVALEALNNVLRHSQAGRVTVFLRASERHLLMTIRDDGVSFRPREGRLKGGMGLSSMESRIRTIGGTVRFAAGEGTRVEVRAPLPAGQPEEPPGSES